MVEKLSYEEFVRKAIVSLQKEGYKGIHSVYSCFNNALENILIMKILLRLQTG
ncbi:MAG: hypothetical protein ACUVUQ_06005 [Thermodesulfovibrionales bacterium]